MLKKPILGFAVIAAILLQILGGVKTGSGQDIPSKVVKTAEHLSSYEAKLRAIREEYKAERDRLGLSNAADQLGTPESDLGKPRCHNVGGGGVGGGGSGSSTSSSKTAQHAACSASSKGAPVWMVNMVNLNFYMADTPLWYSSPIGPSVEIQLSYNTNFYHVGPFGNKWLLNYGSYLYPYYGGIMIIMPDGRQDLYYVDSWGGYTHPYQVFNTLTKIAENHFELKFPDGTVYVYNIPSGTTTTSNISLLVEIRDAYGQKLSLGYDANAKLMTITDAMGKVTILSYNTEGLVTQAADPFGRSASFEYDANGNLTKITDMAGYWTSFAYQHRGVGDYYLDSLQQEAGYNWGFYFEYADGEDNGGNPYPAPGKAMGYNSRITVTVPPVTDPSVPGGKEEYYRSASGYAWYVSPKNYIPYSDPDNNNYASNVPKTLYEYFMTSEYRGETGSVVSPEGTGTSFGYEDYDDSGNSTGNITTISNEVMGDMSLTYNSMGNVTSVQGWSYPVTSMTYAANGVDLTSIMNGLGTISIGYNGSHDITSSTDRMGNTKTIAYNGYGQITSGTDLLGVTTNYTYDSNHLLSQVTRSGQTLKSYTYDAIGRVRTYTDATGMTRTYDYNNLNDITKITYPDGKDISIAYSSYHPHLITAITDRSGKTTKYTYNKSEWLTKILNPEGGATEFDYDANGNLIQLVDPNGNATGFDYDNDNRLVKKTFADGTSVSFTYDGANRLASYTNARNGSAYYYYNPGNNLTRIMYYDLPFITPMVMYQYDAYYRRTGMIDAAGTHKYSYDADSLLTGITGPLKNDARTFQYDAKGRMTGYALQGGQSLSYTYDALDRLTSINNSAGTFSYSYLGASPLIQKLTRPNGSYTEYQYDNVNRLTMLSNKTSSGSIINQYAYAYNAEDLRSSETITNGTPITSFVNGSTTYSYNNVNELLSSTGANQTFVYDADGNMTQGYTPAGYSFTGTYDFENRLTLIQYTDSSGLDHQTEYTYNGNGIMTEKKVDWEDETSYVLTGGLPSQERDKTNNVIREYTWGSNDGGGIRGLLSLNQGGQNYFYLYDGKGNVTAGTDSTQSVVATYAYDPFGKLMTKTGVLDQPYQFSTKPYDEKTGLSYYGYRFYSPEIGRWMTKDPLGEGGGINLYGFVGNSPVNRADPIGLEGEESECSSPDPNLAEQVIEGAQVIWESIKSKWADLVNVFSPGAKPPTVTPMNSVAQGGLNLAKGIQIIADERGVSVFGKPANPLGGCEQYKGWGDEGYLLRKYGGCGQ